MEKRPTTNESLLCSVKKKISESYRVFYYRNQNKPYSSAAIIQIQSTSYGQHTIQTKDLEIGHLFSRFETYTHNRMNINKNV